MAKHPVLNVVERTNFGKGAARQARMAQQLPAVVYGHGTDPVHVLAPYHDTFLIVKDNPNAVVTLKGLGKDLMVLVKAIQRHPVRRHLMHLDLLLVKADEKVLVEVPVEIVGESAPGTNCIHELLNLEVMAPVSNIPETIEINIDGLADGTVIRVSDLKLPAGVTCDLDPHADVASIVLPASSAVEEDEAGAADASDSE